MTTSFHLYSQIATIASLTNESTKKKRPAKAYSHGDKEERQDPSVIILSRYKAAGK